MSVAEAWFTSHGTGVPDAPAFTLPNHTEYNGDPPRAYPYAINGGLIQPTITRLDYDNPSSITVSFLATSGQALAVSWSFEVGASGRVGNRGSHVGKRSAGGLSIYDHSVNWGGITSVVDSVTGEPDEG